MYLKSLIFTRSTKTIELIMYLSSGSWYRHNNYYGYSPTVVMVVGAAVVLAVVVITSMESEPME